MKYSQGLKHDYCSCKCSASSKEIREKTKHTNLEKYGCENVFQNKEIQEKIKQTNLERHGCEYSLQNKEVRKKIKQTNLERFGCEHSLQNEAIKNKIKQTNLEKYGHEYTSQCKEIREKIKQTNLERFGCENPSQSEEIKQILHNKSYDNLIPKFIKHGVAPDFLKEEYTGYNKVYKWKCLICQNEFEQKIYPTNHVKECQYLPHCWKCYPRMSGESRFELEVFDFVKQYFPNARQHDRIIISPQELDIVVSELKLAIEYNGNYFHSTEFKLPGFHLNKTIEANEKGYRLIHIWENEFENIKNKLIDIFQNKENLNFTKDKIKLDRSWYNNLEIPNYKLIEELPPEIVNRSGYNVENCGYLIYERINILK